MYPTAPLPSPPPSASWLEAGGGWQNTPDNVEEGTSFTSEDFPEFCGRKGRPKSSGDVVGEFLYQHVYENLTNAKLRMADLHANEATGCVIKKCIFWLRISFLCFYFLLYYLQKLTYLRSV